MPSTSEEHPVRDVIEASQDPFQDDAFQVGDAEVFDEVSIDEAYANGNMSVVWSDASSLASTIRYEHEPYETFQDKATQLMLSLFPNLTVKNIQVERMAGGGYNRVVGITISEPRSQYPWYSIKTIRETLLSCIPSRDRLAKRPCQQYVLRIPRNGGADMQHQVSTLSYVASTLRCPVPKVVVFDSSSENALGQAYMLQERLPGQSLDRLWETMNHAQRKSASREISKIVLQLGEPISKYPGILSVRNTAHDFSQGQPHIERMPIPRTHADPTSSPPAALAQSPREWLLSLCERQQAFSAAHGLPALPHLWLGLRAMIDRLHALGFLPDTQPFHLHHGDLEMRNLLACIVDERTVRVTGVLDWDFALFAPRFLARRAPYFLWTDGDSDEEEEANAVLEPPDARCGVYKRVFERMAGSQWLEEAYGPEAVLLRKMFPVLVRGFHSAMDVQWIEDVLGEFRTLYPPA